MWGTTNLVGELDAGQGVEIIGISGGTFYKVSVLGNLVTSADPGSYLPLAVWRAKIIAYLIHIDAINIILSRKPKPGMTLKKFIFILQEFRIAMGSLPISTSYTLVAK